MRRIRRTTTIAMATLAAMVTGALLVMAPTASGQTGAGYPPGPPPTTVPRTVPGTTPPPVVTLAPPAVQPVAVFQTLPPAAAPAVSSAGAVAFTGANILKWGLTALVLVAVGSLLVVFNRRRRDRLTA